MKKLIYLFIIATLIVGCTSKPSTENKEAQKTSETKNIEDKKQDEDIKEEDKVSTDDEIEDTNIALDDEPKNDTPSTNTNTDTSVSNNNSNQSSSGNSNGSSNNNNGGVVQRLQSKKHLLHLKLKLHRQHNLLSQRHRLNKEEKQTQLWHKLIPIDNKMD